MRLNGKYGMSDIFTEDLININDSLSLKDKKFYEDKSILITGAAGFIGFYLVNFFLEYLHELNIREIVLIDNHIAGSSNWFHSLKNNSRVRIDEANVIDYDYETKLNKSNSYVVFHLASIASPVFYRKNPIETIDANVSGYRNLLDYFRDNQNLSSMVFFSSSEVYGNPDANNIPTSEEYNGNVSAIGPRACYDESKRLGETLSFVFSRYYNLPIKIVRPFNNYGPGMKINDGRVVSDFLRNVLNGENLKILSNGKQTRTFCYISDSIAGIIKVAAFNGFEVFNIGNETPEISVENLASIYITKAKKIMGFDLKVEKKLPTEEDFSTDSPDRRVPDISKARTKLKYNPKIDLETGIERFIKFHFLGGKS